MTADRDQDMLDILFTPTRLGRIELANRFVMAPMTRSRADSDGSPNALMLEYYRQRASAGLILTEGCQPSADGQGYCRTPGMHTAAHVKAWRGVCDAVRERGGRIALQLMHCGRVAHPLNKQAGTRTLAPSAIAARSEIFTEQGMQPCVEPEAMTATDIDVAISDYRRATEMAFEAGFDGVELHATSGYLPAQFLSSGSNHRSDEWGGSLEARLRFTLEVMSAIASVDGPDRVGIRICPGNPFNDLQDDDPDQTFRALLTELSVQPWAWLHVIRTPATERGNLDLAREAFDGTRLYNESFSPGEAAKIIESGEAQAVSFGRPFIANPDFVERIKAGLPLINFNAKTLYSPGPEGYTDYLPAQ